MVIFQKGVRKGKKESDRINMIYRIKEKN